MAYQPKEPLSIEDVDQLLQYVQDELGAIAGEMADMSALELRTVSQPPIRPRDGMIVSADGVGWNPGGGAGIYARVGGAWVKL